MIEGLVDVRLSGETADSRRLLDLLTAVGCELKVNPKEYTNHREAGARIYASVKLPN